MATATTFLVILFWLCLGAGVALVCREKGVRPFRDAIRFFGRQPAVGRVLLGAFFIALWMFAGAKPGERGEGARGEVVRSKEKGAGEEGEWREVVRSKEEVVSAEDSSSVVAAGGTQQDVDHDTSSLRLPPCSLPRDTYSLLPTPYSLTNGDFARGFVLARVGTGEESDFAPPPGATVVDNWRAFGAAEDWTYVAFTNWAFRVGTNGTSRLRVFSFGRIEPLGRGGEGNAAARAWFAPFIASLGIVPQANWGRLCAFVRPSQVWYATTPEGSLSVTWQNALLGRDAERPVSFQAEFFPNGRFVYRYDLSRLGAEAAADVLVGASLGGGAWTTNALPTNVTSMAFYPLTEEDRDSPDADGDGLPTADELFLHGTDPHNADTDRDGLTDYEELLVHGTDPLNPRSVRDDFSDGIAARLGGLDPFACPEGSTNTVLEHVFYSGATNGAFAFPRSSDKVAVLRVSASGSGTGDLIVGDAVVPLVGRGRGGEGVSSKEKGVSAEGKVVSSKEKGVSAEGKVVSSKEQVVSAESSSSVVTAGGTQQDVDHDTYSLLLTPSPLNTSSLLPTPSSLSLSLSVPRGVALPLYLRADGTLSVSLSSDDFAFGVLPTHASSGWINFPNTAATEPCIHDYAARKTRVWLPVGEGAEALACTWRGDGNVEVENHPPRAATITGNFPARGTAPVTYTLSHPDYLFGQASYAQSARFCPKPPDPDPEEPDPPWYAGGGSGGGGHGDMRWCCHWGTCGDGCDCGCDCAAAGGGGPDPSDGDAFGEGCPEHSTPYADCAPLHADDYTNAVQSVPRLGGVLYIREPPSCERIRLDVPAEHRNCCPCPDHWTNHVGVAYKSRRLRLVDADGRDFGRTETSCDVLLSGVSPSAAVGDAALAFARNGEVYRQYAKTVLGVAIRGGPGVDLAACNALSRDFGYPMTVCTNEWNAPEMRLVTNVRLPDGNVHLELANATGQFAVWHLDRRTGERCRLLDSATTPVKNLPMAYWKALMRRATDGGSAELPIWITSSAPGAATLVFRYWNVIDGRFVQDEAAQRITSLLPPLRLDVSRDGRIDDGDAAAWLDGRTFHYWINEDTVKGDCIVPNAEYPTKNSDDLVVNGTFDLINFFPVALDLSKFADAWQDRVTYTLRPEWGGANSFNFCFADLPWSQAGTMQTATVTTLAGEPLSAASLEPLSGEGYRLDPHDTLMRFSKGSGLVICEAKSSYATLRIDIKAGDTTLYSYSAPMTLLPVKKMYGWINGRSLSGGSTIRATAMHRIWDEQNTKSLIFLHGANVSEAQAETWGDILFKRMWVSGVRADFYNVDWRSDIGAAYDYHENASNAFAVASRLAPILSGIGGDKVVMAHSLGNMVVSSMIQDYGLKVSRYIMCNSAVPAEAYDTSLPPENVLVHKDWDEYPRKSFANEWYRCFEEDAGDDRQLLTWSGRFSDVADYAVNFYSTGDHVLELERSNKVWAADGYENWSQKFERYSWHKQELWKGRRGLLFNMGTTDWAGWSMRENIVGYNTIQPTNAWLMSEAELKTNTVFKVQPESMNTNSIPLLVRGAHLAMGIPSRTPPSGAVRWGDADNMDMYMFDLNDATPSAKIPRPNGWVARPNGWFSDWGNRWLHSDIKDMAYFYVFKFFEKVKETGGLE